jgi:endonuclease III
LNEAKRREIFSRLKEGNPAPRTELQYSSPFELLVAVILSAQATDRGVNKATPALFQAANTPAAMLALGVDGLIPYIKTIGLFNTKAKNIIATCGAPQRCASKSVWPRHGSPAAANADLLMGAVTTEVSPLLETASV